MKKRSSWMPLGVFVLLSFSIAWAAEWILRAVAAGAEIDIDVLRTSAETMRFDDLRGIAIPHWVAYLLTRCQDFAFSLAGVIVVAATEGRRGLRQLLAGLTKLRVRPWVYAMALLPCGLYFIATIVADGGAGNVLGSFTLTRDSVWNMLLGAEYGVLVTLFLRGPMGEEIGLRGYALPNLQTRVSPFCAALSLGAVWAVWHTPILVTRPAVIVVAFLLITLSLSFLFTWLYNHSNGSLIPVLILHTAQNSEEVFETIFPQLKETNWELTSAALLLLCGIMAAIAVWRTGVVTDRRGSVEDHEKT